jgi:hypothetical protein
MAFITIYTFLTASTGSNYEIKYDPDTLTIDTELISGPGQAFVSEADLGVPYYTVFYQHCTVDFSLCSIKAKPLFPFAYLQQEFNSPACGYVPPGGGCDLVITSIDVVNESVAGAMDGMITVNTTGGSSPNYFSLDAMTFQPSNVFTDLVPGNYIVYVANSDYTCGGYQYFTIAAGPAPSTLEIPWTEKLCHFFKLIRNGIEYNIAEPVKWDAVNFVGKRDVDWHGWSSQYSDGVLELEFDCAAGKDVIEAEYLANGNDGIVYFQYGYIFNSTNYPLFDGKLNLNTRKLYPEKVTCSVEKKDFNSLFQTRYETKVSMTDNVSIDGNPIGPAPVLNFIMHTKQVATNYKNKYPDLITAGQTVLPAGQTVFYLQPETSVPQISEIEDYFGYPIGFSNTSPVTDLKYSWKMKFAGDYTFTFKWNYALKFKPVLFSRTVTIKTFYKSPVGTQQLGATVSGTCPAGSVTPFNTVINSTIVETLAADAEIYIWTELTFSTGATTCSAWADQSGMDTSVLGLEASPSSDCNGWFLFDAVNQCIKSVTNSGTKLKSSFLQKLGSQQAFDGQGSLYVVTNGKQIRKFEVDKNPLQISTKDLMESVKAIFCLGMGHEPIGTIDIIRVERVNYFYQNKQIIVIEECYDYFEEVAKDIIYNEFEFGYEKFQSDGFNTLDEFNTVRNDVGPIKTNKLKLSQKSKLITSGYSIEQSRRQQFSVTPTDSFQNDDEGFLISMSRLSPVTYATEKDENFQLTENLISPETAYNLRISPVRMLVNWAIWIYNLFHYKPTTEKIKNTFHTQNGLLRTQLLATDPRPVGDINRAIWQDNQDIVLSDLPVEERIYRPEWINFKARLTADKIQRIERAMRGGHTEDINYGYVVVKDDNGDYQGGFLYELNYNFSTESAQIKMLKKFDSPVVPGAECCPYLLVNGCRLVVKTSLNPAGFELIV